MPRASARYVESLSAYARQFLPQMDKPDVDKGRGAVPGHFAEQQTATRNPRSTVGTVTEVYDFLRVFFARLGKFYCPSCGKAIEAQTTDEIVERILAMEEGARFMILAPLVEHQKGTHKDLFAKLKKDGFVRVRVGGELYSLDEVPELEKNKKHTIDLVVDRLVLKEGIKKRLGRLGGAGPGQGRRAAHPVRGRRRQGGRYRHVHPVHLPVVQDFHAPADPRSSSPSTRPRGACETCNGIGSVEYFEPDLIAPNKGLSLDEGGVIPWNNATRQRQYGPQLKKLGKQHGFTMDTPLADFSTGAWSALFYGDRETGWPGVVPILGIWPAAVRRLGPLDRPVSAVTAPARPATARGSSPRRLAVRVADKNMVEFTSMSIQRALEWLQGLEFSGHDTLISEPLLKELTHRARLHGQRGAGISFARPQHGHPVRRRGPAHPAGVPAGVRPGGRDLRPGRAVHRPAPARQPAAPGHPALPAEPGQHRARGGARRADHPRGGPRHRDRPQFRLARRRDRVPGQGRRPAQGGFPDRQVPARRSVHRAPGEAAQAQGGRSSSRA